MRNTIRLLIACPDARGIVAAVTTFIAEQGGNLLDADQHTDLDHNEFFMRVAVARDGFGLAPDTFAGAWEPLARRYRMQWSIHWGQPIKRVGILVSKQGHCLSDLLWRWKSGELDVEIPIVISNHGELGPMVRDAGVRFEVCLGGMAAQGGMAAAVGGHAARAGDAPHGGDPSPAKLAQEREILALLAAAQVDAVVLARYMQVLSPDFVRHYPHQIINIHHSFLPAFAGGAPYRQAYERGVKMIGATSHYVTDQLDAGPIIAQATAATSHRDTISDLIRKGRDLERMVLAHAVRLHVEDRILVSQNKTVVFE
jgi:formyltetrahydrofolate deformylase